MSFSHSLGSSDSLRVSHKSLRVLSCAFSVKGNQQNVRYWKRDFWLVEIFIFLVSGLLSKITAGKLSVYTPPL